MKHKHLINEDIECFYSKISDEDRYTKGLGPLELERNKLIIQRFINKPKSVIIDVGGGTGIYAEWLAKQGHQVHLVDPIKKHIQKSKKKAALLKDKFLCYLGASHDLPMPENFADIVILHGPLYHLQNRRDRIKALNEAKRVCKKNGIVIGVAINFASFTIAGLLNGMIHQTSFFEMCKKHLATGIHFPPENTNHVFLPEAFFHKPEEFYKEFEEISLRNINLLAVEGLGWLDKDFYQSFENPVKKKQIMSLILLTENDRSLLSFSPHMLAVGTK